MPPEDEQLMVVGDAMAADAEAHYFHTLMKMADLIVSYGYHRCMVDLTEIVDDRIYEIDSMDGVQWLS